ncbi:hypothetical protein HDU76_005206 [Blyttiomyces sp. JEL0837]|nr:hypothetical protein HDU76_005206 [Blyttiomyces sp. JEL0837]
MTTNADGLNDSLIVPDPHITQQDSNIMSQEQSTALQGGTTPSAPAVRPLYIFPELVMAMLAHDLLDKKSLSEKCADPLFFSSMIINGDNINRFRRWALPPKPPAKQDPKEQNGKSKGFSRKAQARLIRHITIEARKKGNFDKALQQALSPCKFLTSIICKRTRPEMEHVWSKIDATLDRQKSHLMHLHLFANLEGKRRVSSEAL